MLAEREDRQQRQAPQEAKVDRYGDDKLIGQTQQEWQALMEQYEREMQAKKNSSLGEQSSASISSSDLSDSTVVAEEERIKMNEARVYVGRDENNNHARDATRETPFDCTTEVSQCLEQLVEAVASATNNRPPYETFKLNEVLLAETRSSTSESEDEFAWQFDVKLVGEFCIEQAEFEHNKQHVINLAQDYYSIQSAKSQQAMQIDLSPGTDARHQAQHAIDCLASERFVVWIVKKENGCEELDLDDIALALNETVSSAAPKQDVRVIIWHCLHLNDSRRIETLWRNSIRRQVVEPPTKQADDKQIEIPSTSSAENSSGLFVLPDTRSEPKEVRCNADHIVHKASGTSDSPSSSILANCYRTVANKVMTNGSTKLRNLKEEMSRLNGSRQSLAKSARRLSMAIQNQTTKSEEPASATSCAVPPKVTPRTSVLKASRITSGKENTSQVGRMSEIPDERQPRSILKKSNKSSRPTQAEREKEEGVVGVSLRKQPLVQQNPAPDINTNRERDEPPVSDSERLLRLRAGSTSSVTGRSRQRRPALLLRNEEAEQPVDVSAVSPLPVKTTSSARVDGLVRARVRASHLKRSASMKMIDVSAKQQVVAAMGTKKSEFDPRSLRRLPAETAQALRCGAAGADVESDPSRLKLHRQRRSVADFQALISSPSDDEMDDEFAAINETTRANDGLFGKLDSSKLGSTGALNTLRQSFNQRNLSAMLKFPSSRASFRAKPADLSTPVDALAQTRAARKLGHEFRSASGQDLDQQANSSGRRLEKAEALRLAEAKLQAAKQLKQQAQKLREQQKRLEQQQQQQASLDSVAMLLYQQQIQRQQQLIYHHQQQQHQQQLLFDPLNVQLRQHQQLFAFQRQQQQQHQQQQQQQQQQLAYTSSAHFMAQHVQQPTGAAVANFSHMYPMAQLAGPAAMPALAAQTMLAAANTAPPQLHGLPGTINHSMISSHAGMNNKPIYRQSQAQQYIPMSVNHHSSFNIVYATAAASSNSHSQAPTSFVGNHQPNRNQPQPAALNMTQKPQMSTDDETAPFRKHSSLGASLRKTVRSILNKTSTSSSSSHKLNLSHIRERAAPAPLNQKPLKSALKQANAAAKERDLNSEGSDGDASSTSDSTVDCSRPMPSKSVLKRSMMREQDHQKQFASKKEQISPSSSSESSLASSSSSDTRKSSTLTRNDMERLRKEFIRNEPSQFGDTHHRKNVTFSSQLISIL